MKFKFYFEIVLVIFLILIFNYFFGFAIGKVSGDSMYSTFKNGEYFIYFKLPVKLKILKKGDVVVYTHYYEDAGKQSFIKRIKCIPGNYVYKTKDSLYDCSYTYVSGSKILNGYFLVGDNLKVSLDSRYCFSYGGCMTNPNGYEIRNKDIVGKVIFKF